MAEEQMQQVTEADFTFVAIDAERRPRPVPPGEVGGA
jgi:acyl-CoA hydrolase